MFSNLESKSQGDYTDLSLTHAIINSDLISFVDFVEEILSRKEYSTPLKKESYLNRIDINFDHNIISKWDLPFDSFSITLYRDGWEVESKYFTSNYMYMENENCRTLWIDLYYTKDEYDSDDVFRDILIEINNFINRDFKKYLKEEYGK